MKIETKYNIGDRVWIVYESQGEVCVYDTEILEIGYDKDGINYYTKECNDYEEDFLIPYNKKEELLKRIETLMNEIHLREFSGFGGGADNIE